MTQDATPRWDLPLLHAGQAQKELFHNEALARIDMLLHGVVESADMTTPPESPTVGQCWIVGDGAIGAWTGQEGTIACWTGGGWRFATPRAGLAARIVDRGHDMIHDGTGWSDGPLRADGIYLGGVRVVGAQAAAIADPAGGAVIDEDARVAIGAILAVLRGHGLIGA
jgi:hypothetical protein